jgi:hypothetical protein
MKGTGHGGEDWTDFPQTEASDAKIMNVRSEVLAAVNRRRVFILNKTAVNFSETLVNIYHTTWNHILYFHTNEHSVSKRDRKFLD